jgi:polysaccharide export outer membrane protein
MFGLTGCAFWLDRAPVGHVSEEAFRLAPEYQLGPGDQLQVFVWKNPELSVVTPVRPDGRISIPLLQDVQAAGLSPAELAASLRTGLTEYIKDPVVTVLVQTVQGTGEGRVNVVGEAVEPKSVPYRAGLTALDVMVDVGGLTEFADGNDARLIRMENGKMQEYRLNLADLMKDGDINKNVALKPGDVIRIPERWF